MTAGFITTSISPDHLLSKCYRTDPKTLMFAHALGMGLFEKEKLRWLEDSEWAACGYTFDKKGGIYKLKREHLRRFEDLQSFNFNSVDVVFCDEGQPVETETRVVDFIKKIKHDNQTVKPDDIGIILLDGTKDSYLLADKLEQIIPREIGWEVNKAYESKEKKLDSVLISNRNNVKGLEFPFVICITSDLRKSYSFRNALYTMLTRSFLQSTLIITKPQDANFVAQIKQGLANINENGQIVVAEPTEEEKIRIRTTIQQRESKLSLYDQFHLICDDFGIEKGIRQKLYSSFKEISDGSFDLDFLEEWINTNYSLFLKKMKSHENH